MNEYVLLGIFCVLRTAITVFPELNVYLLSYGYLHIMLNDIVILFIWLLVSFICAKSILGQYGVLKIVSFRQLFIDAFHGNNIGNSLIKSACVFILTALSISYVLRMVYFIYEQWSTKLSPLLQALQMYPAFLMCFQTLYQGSCLLKYLLHPDINDSCRRDHRQQFLDHIWLNFAFILHSICIFIVIHLCVIEPKIVLELVTGEVVYRLFAILEVAEAAGDYRASEWEPKCRYERTRQTC